MLGQSYHKMVSYLWNFDRILVTLVAITCVPFSEDALFYKGIRDIK